MNHDLPPPSSLAERRPYRPPIGIPRPPGESRRVGAIASVAIHLTLLLLLLAPVATSTMVDIITDGAGGPGPAGGGGGGTGGTGGQRELEIERLRYLQVAPQGTMPTAEEMTPPTEPEPEVEEQPVPTTPQPEAKPVEQPSVNVSAILGAGGGTGNDGTAGSGSGTGGGIGSGVGTGRGSGVGPGTGGGEGSVYPPSPIEVIIPPLPVPRRIKGTEVVAIFDVDTAGRVLSVTFNPTRDREYNSELRDRLERYRFRPAVLADGTPVRAKVPIPITLP